MTVVSWGVYGIFLHSGQMGMQDKVNGRYMAFLYVGFAYFLIAVLAPLAVLAFNKGRLDFWNYPTNGLWWSLIAGVVVPWAPSESCWRSERKALHRSSWPSCLPERQS